MRVANKQREIEALRYNWDGLNQICEILGYPTEKASIVKRGRESLGNLTDEEHLVFEFMQLRTAFRGSRRSKQDSCKTLHSRIAGGEMMANRVGGKIEFQRGQASISFAFDN